MMDEEREQLKQVMRDKYAVHYTELAGVGSAGKDDQEEAGESNSKSDDADNPDITDTSASDKW